MFIEKLFTPAGDDAFYDPEFHRVLESHIPYLKSLTTTTIYPVEPNLAFKYEGDLFGLLDHFRIGKQYHYVVMRINGFRCTGELPNSLSSLIIPDLQEIDLLKTIYKTKKVTH